MPGYGIDLGPLIFGSEKIQGHQINLDFQSIQLISFDITFSLNINKYLSFYINIFLILY